MKKILLIAVLFIGATMFFSSCSPYFYDRPYDYSYRRAYPPPPPPRVYVRPAVPYYYSTPPPVRYKRHHTYRNNRRY